MKLFRCILFILSTGFVSYHTINCSDAVITLFIKEKPQVVDEVPSYNQAVISQKLQQPKYIKTLDKKQFLFDSVGVDGLQASYLGYITASDKNGQITFPRHQQSDTVYLLITPKIQPLYMISPTLIHHWITKKNHPAACYEISRKENKKLKTYYSIVKKVEIPKDIEKNTIILYAHPDHIHVPLGISLNTYSAHLILPEIQAKKIDIAKNSLYTLSIKQYFEPINIEVKNDMSTISTMIINQ